MTPGRLRYSEELPQTFSNMGGRGLGNPDAAAFTNLLPVELDWLLVKVVILYCGSQNMEAVGTRGVYD